MINLKSCVIQEEKFGCSIACMATILQKGYYEVRQHFSTNLGKNGITSKQIFNYLSSEGLDIAFLQQMSWSNRKSNNTRISKPFADIHILSIKSFIDRATEHSIIMTRLGKLFCPSNGKEWEIKNTYIITDNLGIWYPKSWRFKK